MRRRTLLKVVAVLEVVGGIGGPVLVLVQLARAGFPAEMLAGAALATALFLLSVFAGLRLWQDRPAGYVASAAVQFAQLLKVFGPQFAFLICFGSDLVVMSYTQQDAAGNQIRKLGVQSQIGPVSVIEFGRPPGAPQALGVSILSCVALAALRKGREPVPDDDHLSDNVATIQVSEGHGDGQPDWVLPFRLKLVLGLFIFVLVSCCGLVVAPRLFG